MNSNRIDPPTTWQRKIVFTIDPAKMTQDENCILFYFLEENLKRDNKQFISDTEYGFPPCVPDGEIDQKLRQIKFIFPDEEPIFYIKLTHTLRWRECSSTPRGHRFDVYTGVILGDGTYAIVEEIDATLVPQSENYFYYKKYPANKTRVAKLEEDRSKTWIESEYKLTARFPELHVKPPTFFSSDSEIKSSLVMRRIYGMSLEKIIDQDGENKIAKINTIPTDIRIQMAIAFLLALKKVHAKNIVHRDIKPSNIIVDLSSDPIDVTILDYGLSTDAIKNDRKSGLGTGLYAAPEFFDLHILTAQTDIYSAAWVLAMIFRANDNECYSEDSMFEAISKIAVNSRKVSFIDLFAGMDDLHDYHQHSIESILYQMVTVSPNKRPTVDDILKVFEKIQLKRKLIAVLPAQHQNFVTAYYAGIKLRNKLDTFPAICPAKFPELFPALKESFDQKLKEMLNEQDSVKEFIAQTKIRSLRGLVTTKQIIDEVNQLLYSFEQSLKNLQRLQECVIVFLRTLKDCNTGAELHKLNFIISSFLESTTNSIHPDTVSMLRDKFNKYVEKINAEISKLKVKTASPLALEQKARPNKIGDKIIRITRKLGIFKKSTDDHEQHYLLKDSANTKRYT